MATYMAVQETYHFGRAIPEGDIDFPSLSRIADSIEENKFVGEVGRREGVRNVAQRDDFFYCTFVAEMPTARPILDEENRDDEVEVDERRVMNLLLFENGQYVYEGTQDLSAGRALAFLLDIEHKSKSYEDLGSDAMERFYDESSRVGVIKFNNIPSGADSSEDPTNLDDLITDTGEVTDNVLFSVGRHTSNDLQQVTLIDEGFVGEADIVFVSAKNKDGDGRKLKNSGNIRINYDASQDAGQQAREIRSYVKPVLDELEGRFVE